MLFHDTQATLEPDVYRALGGDLSLRPGPYVNKWAPRVGRRAAQLQWFSRTVPGIYGGATFLVGLAILVVGAIENVSGLRVAGLVLILLFAGVAVIGLLCYLDSLTAMSRFFGQRVTIRRSPILADPQFDQWCIGHGIERKTGS